jgi:hypothetical protein
MITMESHLARLVVQEAVEQEEAQKWANRLKSFLQALDHERAVLAAGRLDLAPQ